MSTCQTNIPSPKKYKRISSFFMQLKTAITHQRMASLPAICYSVYWSIRLAGKRKHQDENRSKYYCLDLYLILSIHAMLSGWVWVASLPSRPIWPCNLHNTMNSLANDGRHLVWNLHTDWVGEWVLNYGDCKACRKSGQRNWDWRSWQETYRGAQYTTQSSDTCATETVDWTEDGLTLI
jgi:hypothetical protein